MWVTGISHRHTGKLGTIVLTISLAYHCAYHIISIPVSTGNVLNDASYDYKGFFHSCIRAVMSSGIEVLFSSMLALPG